MINVYYVQVDFEGKFEKELGGFRNLPIARKEARKASENEHVAFVIVASTRCNKYTRERKENGISTARLQVEKACFINGKSVEEIKRG